MYCVYYIYKFIKLIRSHNDRDTLVRLRENVAKKYIRDITRSIHVLHENGIIHRDLKPENLLFVSNDDLSPIKLSDFGLSKLKGASEVKDVIL